MRFRDRDHAGRELAAALADYADSRPVVVALPRGGVPVAYEVALGLEAPMEVLVVRRLELERAPGVCLGAVAEGGGVYLNRARCQAVGLYGAELEALVDRESEEICRRVGAYRGQRAFPDLRRRTVLLVDDGIETGCSLLAAIDALRRAGLARLVVAMPVAQAAAAEMLRPLVDEFVYAFASDAHAGASDWYEQFPTLDDVEVQVLLDRAAYLQEKEER